MADTAAFATLDSGAAPIDWQHSPEQFPTVDSGAAVVAMAGFTLSTVTVTFPTHYNKAQPGRWRDVEG